MPSPRIVTVIVNSERPDELVAFWCGFFHTEIQFSEAGITWLKPTTEGGVNVGIQHVERKVGTHTEIHLDIRVDDLDDAQSTVEELGGALVKINRLDNGFEWRVLTDTDGNEFCVFAEG